jgi:hypothetical protein
MTKHLAAGIFLVVALAGCEQYFRYPCQNPKNWENDECKKPLCEVNRDCPEHIFKTAPPSPTVAPPPAIRPVVPPQPCGACK